MTTNETIASLRDRIAALVAVRLPVLDVVVWRNPGETEAEAIERYMRKRPKIATMPRATRTIHVVSWEGPVGV